nr:Beta-ketoacyl synthase [uncultured bacterium]
MSKSETLRGLEAVAIIGLAGRFPGAKNLELFWRNLREGVESVSFFTDAELTASGVDPALLAQPNYVKARAILDDVELFDASFFGFSPREAEITSPHHRIFLECAWEALEGAGYDSETFAGEVGVFAGMNMSTYLINLFSNPEVLKSVSPFRVTIGNDKDFLPTLVSYKLNLKGPSVNVQTGCSTSLVAVHLACQSLLNYECDMALAGGVQIHVPQKHGYLYEEGGVSSPDGHCRSFDAGARGAVGGDGVGVVVLKRLEEALGDGDHIHAVIRGSAINNDGASKIGYTAPSVQGQSKVIAMAMAVAGVNPEDVSYVEAHGSATPLGDPIEVAALTQAYRAVGAREKRVAVGCVKTNVGHTGASAGIAGLIKTVLALKHREIPPSLHFESPNPQIDFDGGPFSVNDKLTEWRSDGRARTAGVSSFGIGGTNAHVIVEEAPRPAPSAPARPWRLLLLSAKSPSALEAATDDLAAHLRAHPEQSLADVEFTLQTGRRAFNHRRFLVCDGAEDAAAALETRSAKRLVSGLHEPAHRSVAFMLPGLGNHYVGMGRGLYETETEFRESVDLCCELLKPHTGLDLREVLYPADRHTTTGQGINLHRMLAPRRVRAEDARPGLHQTSIAQPALFVVEYALAALWMSWGLRPEALIGYSIGEYVAACLAGVMSLEDALRLVAERARLIQESEAGAMLAVPLAEDEALALASGTVALAGVNGPSMSVLSGSLAGVAALEGRLHAQGIACRRLETSHAFHSPLMKPLADDFAALVGGVKLNPPRVPFVSNVTGNWITDAEATDPLYWSRHLCEPVRFADGVAKLSEEPSRLFLEVGPGQMLSSLVIQQAETSRDGRPPALASMRHVYDEQPDRAVLLGALGQLWLAGAKIDWAKFHAGEKRRRVQLPTYPFERQRYWVERPRVTTGIQPQEATGEEASPSSSLAAGAAGAREGGATLYSRPELGTPYVAPESSTEQTIAEMWQKLLGIERVGVNDDFFQLGGNSLLGIQITSQLRQEFQVEIPVHALFQATTVSELALIVEDALLAEIESMSDDDASRYAAT